ncbi:MAG: tetratricopeptide repeat protein [candidate division KSB1 bacterium]|nr:tetratricopeptide repeat protein [candidate division KSB1 bacterium]
MGRYLCLVLALFVTGCASRQPQHGGTGTSLNELVLSVKLAPEDVDARVRLGVAYARLGQLRQAVAQFDSALKRAPEYPPALYEKGQTLRTLGLHSEGKNLILRAVRSPAGGELLARLARELGRPFHIEQLTTGRYHHAFATWFPDGQRLALQSNRGGNWDLYVLNIRTGALTRLTEHPGRDEAPFVSHDGSVLVFTSTRDSEPFADPRLQQREIYLYALDKSQVKRLTTTHTDDFHPVLDPQGHTLFFVSAQSEKRRTLMALDLTRRTTRPVTGPDVDSFGPAVSPDGAFLLFVQEENGRSLLCELELRTGRISILTDALGAKASPCYSPDGKQIVFAAKDNGRYDLFLMARDGTALLRLTDDEAIDGHPRFSPEGDRIVFHSDRTRVFQLYLIDLTRPPAIEELEELF